MKSRRANCRTPLAFVVLAFLPQFVHAAEAPAASGRGAAVYGKYCALCHGVSGKGDGRAARLQQVTPADLTASERSAGYKSQIVRGGGAAMKRSASMPAWGEVLSEGEIQDVVAFLQTLSTAGPSRGAAQVAADPKATQGRSP